MSEIRSLRPSEQRPFRRLAEQAYPEQPEKIEDSVELIGEAVEKGPGPLQRLDRRARLSALQLALEAFPAGPQSSWLGEEAFPRMADVERVRSQEELDSHRLSLNGIGYNITNSPPSQKPGFESALQDYLELKTLIDNSGSNRWNKRLDTRKSLEYLYYHFQDEEDQATFKILLGKTGESFAGAWGTHYINEKGGDLDRIGQLAPGLTTVDLYELVPLSGTAEQAVWDKVAASKHYPSAVRRAQILEKIDRPLEPTWDQFESFERSLQDAGLSEHQVSGFVEWLGDHFELLEKALPNEEDLPAKVVEVLEQRWRGPIEQGQEFVEVMVAQQQEGESWQDCAQRLADAYWLHGSYAGREKQLEQLAGLVELGELEAVDFAHALQEFEYRLRLERVVGRSPEEAVSAAFESLSRRDQPGPELVVEDDLITIGGHPILVED